MFSRSCSYEVSILHQENQETHNSALIQLLIESMGVIMKSNTNIISIKKG